MNKYLHAVQRLETELADECVYHVASGWMVRQGAHPINGIITHFTSHKKHMTIVCKYICSSQMQINLQIDKTDGQIIVEGKKIAKEMRLELERGKCCCNCDLVPATLFPCTLNTSHFDITVKCY